MNVRISSRAFSNGFEIVTPTETLTTDNSSYGELLIFNSVGTQLARVVTPSFFSSENNIIISGGGGYQLVRHSAVSSNWTCNGEGRTLELQLNKAHWFSATTRYAISEGGKTIAECSTTAFSDDYKLSLIDESDFKLVVCIVIAVAISERSSGPMPM
jgi:hypothetical protein